MASISFSSRRALAASTGTLKNLFQAGSGYKTERKNPVLCYNGRGRRDFLYLTLLSGDIKQITQLWDFRFDGGNQRNHLEISRKAIHLC